MDNLGYVKGTLFAGLLITVNQGWAANATAPVKVSNYVIPSVFANALYQGMSVPVFIRYEGDNSTQRSQQKIADAILTIKDNEFRLNQIALSDLPERTELSPQIKSLINEMQDKSIGDGQRVYINKDASLSLDTRSFYLELTVNRAAMQAAILPRTNVLGESTAQDLSSVLNYSMGSYYNKYENTDSASSYLTLDNTWSLREHHLNFNGSLYGIGTSNQQSKLYRSMYERDYQGRRFAMGMVDTWNLQSIASMSALNSSRIYGISYGNKSSSQTQDNTLALVPVTVFLPLPVKCTCTVTVNCSAFKTSRWAATSSIRRACRLVSTTLIYRWSLTGAWSAAGRRTSIKRSLENPALPAISHGKPSRAASNTTRWTIATTTTSIMAHGIRG